MIWFWQTLHGSELSLLYFKTPPQKKALSKSYFFPIYVSCTLEICLKATRTHGCVENDLCWFKHFRKSIQIPDTKGVMSLCFYHNERHSSTQLRAARDSSSLNSLSSLLSHRLSASFKSVRQNISSDITVSTIKGDLNIKTIMLLTQNQALVDCYSWCEWRLDGGDDANRHLESPCHPKSSPWNVNF